MRGGARPNCGRKRGVKQQWSLRAFFTRKEVQDLILRIKEEIKHDNKLKMFMIEQLFGKAPQRIEMTGADGKDFGVVILPIRGKQDGLASATETSSGSK